MEYVILIIICVCGFFFYSWMFQGQIIHGPNSKDWRGAITEENGKYYEWDIDICICPLF